MDTANELKLLFQEQRLDDAVLLGEAHLRKFPNDSRVQLILGACYLSASKVSRAIEMISRLCQREPANVEALNILAICYKKKSRFKKSKNILERAVSLEPGVASYRNNLGNVYRELECFEAAEEQYIKATQIDESYFDALKNLGSLYQDTGKLESSIFYYERCLAINPTDVATLALTGDSYIYLGNYELGLEYYEEAFSNDSSNLKLATAIGNCLIRIGNDRKALFHFLRCIENNVADELLLYTASTAITKLNVTEYSKAIESLLLKILDHCKVRAGDLSKPILSLITCSPYMQRVLNDSQSVASELGWLNTIRDMHACEIFMKYLRLTHICDLTLEGLLTNIRYGCLMWVDRFGDDVIVENFLSSLAVQCHLNEYIYTEQLDESENIRKLEIEIESRLASDIPIKKIYLLTLALYRPLVNYDWATSRKIKEILSGDYKILVGNFFVEQHIKANLTSISELSNRVSIDVRKMYEESPYPRWTTLSAAPERLSLKKYIPQLPIRIYSDSIFRVSKPRILIAGCGTGRHALESASLYLDCDVVAIDLSKSSLSYAIRQADQFKIRNIQFFHGDLLEVERLGTEFDIIECCGVLHHMEDPLRGWTALKSCLKPNGLMKIALYSELARKKIIEYREQAYYLRDHSHRELASLRANIIKEGSNEFSSWSDFYSVSEFRDLLFHKSEKQYNLPEIEAHLKDLSLKFCGFADHRLVNKFKDLYGRDSDEFDLSLWNAYEEKNPNTFRGMYQFWCQGF